MTTTPPEAPHGPTGSSEPPPEPTTGGPRVTREEAKDLGRIRRTTTDRKIAGVAGGVARHFDVDPLLVRVGFVLLAVFGGGGVLAYVAGWLLIPAEGSDDGVIRVDHRTRTVLLAIVGAIVALSLVGDSVGGWDFPWPLAVIGLVIAAIAAASRPKSHPGPLPSSGWVPPGTPGQVPGARTGYGPTYDGYRPGPRPRPADQRRRGPILFWFTMALAGVLVALVATVDLAGWEAPPSTYPAVVLAACGVMLLVGAFYGRPGGLIFVGMVAALATLAATVAQDVEAGQIVARPTTAETALDTDYDLFAGEVVIDLTQVSDLEELDGQTITSEAVFGHILVQVPDEGLDVNVRTTVEAGESVLFGQRTDGSDEGRRNIGGDVAELDLDLEVVFGQIEVETKEAA